MKLRDASRAVRLARKACELAPRAGSHWNTLGVAEFRAGNWQGAVEALEKSSALLGDNDVSINAFFLAAAHWQLGHKGEARMLHERAVQWMEKNLPRSEVDVHMVNAIVGVAQGLGIKTVAESVTDDETIRLLRRHGVDFAQGFHVGRPGPIIKLSPN